MDMAVFIKGLLVGFAIAVPVGPIGILCFQRTLRYGRLPGLLTGLGAATADALYGAVAAFGLTAVSGFFIEQSYLLKAIGGAFLFYLAVRMFISEPTGNVEATHSGLLTDYVSTVFLTLANPTTIVSFIAVFAGLGLGSINHDFYSATYMVAGVFCGSVLWWLILSGGVSFIKHNVGPKTFKMINMGSALIILAFSLFAFASLL